MQSRFSFTFYLTALVVLLTWTSLAQGVAINRDLPSRRDLGEGAGPFGADVSNINIMKRDDIALATNPEGKHPVGGRATEDNNEELILDVNGDLDRRWYTLIEIAETPESE